MSAQPVHDRVPLPRIGTSEKDVRRHLPTRLHAQFQDALDEAVDTGNLPKINGVLADWRRRALAETDPVLLADLAAVAEGQQEFLPSPLSR